MLHTRALACVMVTLISVASARADEVPVKANRTGSAEKIVVRGKYRVIVIRNATARPLGIPDSQKPDWIREIERKMIEPPLPPS